MCNTKQADSAQPDWLLLDDLVMGKIFTVLSVRDRFNASLVCRRWSTCFELPKVWRNVDINDHWLKSPSVTDTCTLDYDRMTSCLQRVGHHIQNAFIQPSNHFESLYQFFVLLEWYFSNQKQSNRLGSCNIRKLIFKFPCDQPIEEDPNGIKLFGVGGQLMGSFKKLLSNMRKLCDLQLVDLVLEKYEANSLMDLISLCLNQTLKELVAINLTISHCPLQQIGMLSNLKVLKISPQNIDDSLLHSIVGSNLTHFHIVQNENTPKTAVPCSVKAWSRFKRYASEQLKLHLDAISKRKNGCELLVQPEAPVHSITCENVKRCVVKKVLQNYSYSLERYSDESSATCDNDLIEMVSKCCNLSTLKIILPITTGALLTIAAIGECLQELLVDRSCVIIKCDEWIMEYCYNNNLDTKWVQENSISIESVELAISKHFSRSWHFLRLK